MANWQVIGKWVGLAKSAELIAITGAFAGLDVKNTVQKKFVWDKASQTLGYADGGQAIYAGRRTVTVGTFTAAVEGAFFYKQGGAYGKTNQVITAALKKYRSYKIANSLGFTKAPAIELNLKYTKDALADIKANQQYVLDLAFKNSDEFAAASWDKNFKGGKGTLLAAKITKGLIGSLQAAFLGFAVYDLVATSIRYADGQSGFKDANGNVDKVEADLKLASSVFWVLCGGFNLPPTFGAGTRLFAMNKFLGPTINMAMMAFGVVALVLDIVNAFRNKPKQGATTDDVVKAIGDAFADQGGAPIATRSLDGAQAGSDSQAKPSLIYADGFGEGFGGEASFTHSDVRNIYDGSGQSIFYMPATGKNIVPPAASIWNLYNSQGDVGNTTILSHGDRDINGSPYDESFLMSNYINDFYQTQYFAGTWKQEGAIADNYTSDMFFRVGERSLVADTRQPWETSGKKTYAYSRPSNTGFWDGGGGDDTLRVIGPDGDSQRGVTIDPTTVKGYAKYLKKRAFFYEYSAVRGEKVTGEDMAAREEVVELTTLLEHENFEAFEGTEYGDQFLFGEYAGRLSNADGESRVIGVEIDAGKGKDSVTGSAFDDTITLWGAGDTVSAGTGDDWISFKGEMTYQITDAAAGRKEMLDGKSTVAGGGGQNALDFSGLSLHKAGDFAGGSATYTLKGDEALRVDLATGYALVYEYATHPTLASLPTTSAAVLAQFTGADIVVGSDSRDELYGNANANALNGAEGHDVINGMDGDDVIVDGGGGDELHGGQGDDSLTIGAGNDVVYGDDGDDRIILKGTTEHAEAGYNLSVDFDEIFGGNGSDTVTFEEYRVRARNTIIGESSDLQLKLVDDEVLMVDMANGEVFVTQNYQVFARQSGAILEHWILDFFIATMAFIENVIGSVGKDQIYGNANGNMIDGGAGDDTILGAEGDDTLSGGLGADRLDGGAGFDTLDYQGVYGVEVQLGATGNILVAKGAGADGDTGESFEGIRGSFANDWLVGNDGMNLLEGSGSELRRRFIPDNGFEAGGDGWKTATGNVVGIHKGAAAYGLSSVGHGNLAAKVGQYQAGQLIENSGFETLVIDHSAPSWEIVPGWLNLDPLDRVSPGAVGLPSDNHGEKVLVLSDRSRHAVSQIVKGRSEGETIILTFEYARRADIGSQDGIAVTWNGEVVYAQAEPSDGWTRVTLELGTLAGDNTLSFNGTGPTHGAGIVIDNVTAVGSQRADLYQDIENLSAGEAVTINFQYANPDYDSATPFRVLWNGQEIFNSGSSYTSAWTDKSLMATARDGTNRLQFIQDSRYGNLGAVIDNVQVLGSRGDYLKGGGGFDTYRVAADDLGVVTVDLTNNAAEKTTDVLHIADTGLSGRNFAVARTRARSGQELIANGGFENLSASWSVVSGPAMECASPSGYGLPAAGHGSTVTELDGAGNNTIQQVIANLRAGEKITLQFDYAHTGLVTSDSGMEVWWNGTLVFSATRPAAAWHSHSLAVTAAQGNNTLQFRSTGTGDRNGVVLDNVSAFRSNLIANGDFEAGGAGWTATYGIEADWGALEFGVATAGHGSRVIELDVARNTTVLQTIANLTSGDHILIDFDFVRRPIAGMDTGIGVYWNGVEIFAQTGPADTWQHKQLLVTARGGDNVLAFKGLGNDDGLGVLLDNVVAKRQDTMVTVLKNFVKNGDFEGREADWLYNANGIEATRDASVYGLPTSGHGNVVCELDKYQNTTIHQEFTSLVAGETVAIDFDFARRPGSGADNGLRVWWNGVEVFNSDSPATAWTTKRLMVTAQGDVNRLVFAGTGNNTDTLGVVIDNVAAYAMSISEKVHVFGDGAADADTLSAIVGDGSDTRTNVFGGADLDKLVAASSVFPGESAWFSSSESDLASYQKSVASVFATTLAAAA